MECERHGSMNGMIRELLKELGGLTIFMTCAQLLVYFRPKESYEKYLKLLMSALILLQFLTPIQRLFTGRSSGIELYLEELQEQFTLSAESGEAFNVPTDEDGQIPMTEEGEITVEIPFVEDIEILDVGAGGEDEP